MQPIGGYFSLELPKYEEYHTNAIKLNTGRNCLEYILRSKKYSRVYIPYYSCIVMLEPFQKLGVNYSFYHINHNLEIAEEITLHRNEAILYINYFGLKERYIRKLSEDYGNRLIVDNTQAFYSPPISGIDTFYTCRKFFGVPDGAYLYTDASSDFELEQDVSYDRVESLVKRIDLSPEAGYKDFRKVSDGFIGQSIKKMSALTERLMQSIDYTSVAQSRRNNFIRLHKALSSTNLLNINLDASTVPMTYPYLTKASLLRENLISKKIFIPKFWPCVLEWCTSYDIEHILARDLCPLPIDQRYNIEDMDIIIKNIELTNPIDCKNFNHV